MARDIDVVQDFVRKQRNIPPVHRQVLLARIEQQPTREELDAANAVVYPDGDPADAGDLLMDAWSLICNVGTQRGGWDGETGEWLNAAERWRDRFHTYLDVTEAKKGYTAAVESGTTPSAGAEATR